ncbi:MAG: VOC family protein [Chloroflexi bacterium]|nr:VOC family protein [Chloroflexota bacterium]
MPSSPIVHLEIPAKDFAAADKFFADAFGWKIDVDERFNYHQFSAEGGPGGGFIAADGKQGNVGEVVVYLGSDDIDASLKKVNAAGGKTVTPKTEIPGVGWFAIFTDPTENKLGLYQDIHPH